MRNTDKLLQLAATFEKMAQTRTADPGDVRAVLQRAKLWNISSMVSPLLERAGVPDHTSADINIVVQPGPEVNFSAALTPNHEGPAQQLGTVLKQRFGNLMTQALTAAKVNVAQPVTLNWLRVMKLRQS